MANRVTQTNVEALTTDTAKARVTQLAVEALVPNNPELLPGTLRLVGTLAVQARVMRAPPPAAIHGIVLRVGNVVGNVQGSITWRHPVAGQYGDLDVFIPRGSALFGQVDPVGNQVVEVYGDLLGAWVGVTDIPSYERRSNGVHLTAMHQAGYASMRTVGTSRTFRNLTAGVIARLAFLSAASGGSFWTEGTFVDAAPAIPEYRFTGQSFSAVLDDLMQRTSQEWSVSPDGVFSWLPPGGAVWDDHFPDGAQIQELDHIGGVSDRVDDVTMRAADGRTGRAVLPNVGAWRRQLSLTTGDVADVQLDLEATAEVQRRRTQAVRYTGRLRPTAWVLREGDYLQLVAPWAGFEGECPAVRLLERSYRTSDDYVSAIFGLLPPYEPSGLPKLGLVRQPTLGDQPRVARQLNRLTAQVRDLTVAAGTGAF
jgi:hypothetical protein